MTPAQAYTELQKPVCACGAGKQPGRSFCRGCYYALPPEMRKSLYDREQYRANFAAAVACLQQLGRVPARKGPAVA